MNVSDVQTFGCADDFEICRGVKNCDVCFSLRLLLFEPIVGNIMKPYIWDSITFEIMKDYY